MRRKLAAGNWKMNGSRASLDMLETLAAAHRVSTCDIVICPPHPLLFPAAKICGSGPVQVGAQDCHTAAKGAHTGDIAAGLIAETGARYVIVGHSERREAHGESDAQVRAKAEAAIAAGLTAIVCIGESLEQREAGEALSVIKAQLAGSVPDGSTGATLVVAYEPIWAIGTGRTASPCQAQEVHAFLRGVLVEEGVAGAEQICILYGGSVKAANAAELFAMDDVNGALVGGASLDAAEFASIARAMG